jgi:AraC family transcriptional regulator
MLVEIRNAAARTALCMSHTGDYGQIGQTFTNLSDWLDGNPVEHGLGIAIYYDDPSQTPTEQLRSDAGVLVDSHLAAGGSNLHVVDLPAGEFAVGEFVGHYSGLGAAWGEMFGAWLPSSGRDPAGTPPFEIYIDDCAVVPVEKLRTELWVRLMPE